MITPFVDSIGKFFLDNLYLILELALLALLTWLVVGAIGVLDQRLKRRIEKLGWDSDRQSRMMTLLNVIITTLRAVVLVIAVLTVLSRFGFNLAPILAGAGIAGLAVSLGAQSLIKDFINGFFIILENQLAVGDQVEIGRVRGTVEKISLRTLAVRDYKGALNIIPCSEVRLVTNYSREWSRAVVDLYLPLDGEVGAAVEALVEALREVEQEAFMKESLLEAPQVSGWNQTNEWGVQLRLSAKVTPGQEAAVESIFRRLALAALRQRGIRLALPGQEVRLNSA